jgi:TrmH family RNA methyltransferase
MGTLFRSAEAFGAQGLFLTEGCCDPFNPKAVRASMGSLFRLPFMSGQSWENYFEWFEKNHFYTYALTMEGSDRLPEINFRKPTAFWVGAEGTGLPSDLVGRCGQKVAIPMVGEVESLNVGVAASLALYAARFQGPVS